MNNKNTACACHVTATHIFSDKMCKPVLPCEIKCGPYIAYSFLCVNDTNNTCNMSIRDIRCAFCRG